MKKLSSALSGTTKSTTIQSQLKSPANVTGLNKMMTQKDQNNQPLSIIALKIPTAKSPIAIKSESSKKQSSGQSMNLHSESVALAKKENPSLRNLGQKTTDRNIKPVFKPIVSFKQEEILLFKEPRHGFGISTIKINSQQQQTLKRAVLCRICLEEIQMDNKSYEYKKIPFCEGIFHNTCLKAYIMQSIQDRKFPFKCPDEKCKILIAPEFLQPLLNEKELDFYHKQKLKADALRYPKDYVFCPTPDCEHIFCLFKKKTFIQYRREMSEL